MTTGAQLKALAEAARYLLDHPQADDYRRALDAEELLEKMIAENERLAVAHSRKDAEPVAWKLIFSDEDGISHREVFHSHKHLQEHVRHNSEIRGLKCRVTPLYTSPHPPEADKPADKLTGCACRWDENDNRVLTCVRHQGWLDVIEEWATKAKENQTVIDRLGSACTEQHAVNVSVCKQLAEANKVIRLAGDALKKTAAPSVSYEILGVIRTYLEGKK